MATANAIKVKAETANLKSLKVKLDDGAYEPVRAHSTDAGLDIRTPKTLTVCARGSALIDTGVHVEIPDGYAGLLVSKSGLNVKSDITSTGLIDAGYTGSIVVKLYNHGFQAHELQAGDKISQLVLIRVETPEIELVDALSDTERGDNGFGSTGR